MSPQHPTQKNLDPSCFNLFILLLASIHVDDWELTRLKFYYAWNETTTWT